MTTEEVTNITGVSYSTLDRWVHAGVVTPTQNGKGQGTSRDWSLMEVVAIYYANQLRLMAGTGPKAGAERIEKVAGVEEDELVANIEQHKTLYCPGHTTGKRGDPWMVNPMTLNMRGTEKWDRVQKVFMHAWDIGNSYEVVRAKFLKRENANASR